MYIKRIILDGFKSYGNRTVIDGFDPFFNSITGLNGSGKSNILDSICFVLGISNLSHVRATSLNELVYKNGQAGISKATVTIVFENDDKDQSPISYDKCKEITVSREVYVNGKNKYYINGTSATASRIQDLFQSVGMNVNNPHFIIMQGRITKVLNMKPLEVLSMIEEAAGTRMYETKKDLALRSLNKKESRLKEIESMLDDHICPQLQKLREERKEYTEFTRISRELEKQSKLYVAWDYMQTEQVIKDSEDQKKQMAKKSEELKAFIEEMKQKIADADKRIKEVEKEMDADSGNKLKEFEDGLKKCQVSETKADTHYKNLQDAYNDEKKKNAELKKNLKEEKSSLASKEKEYDGSVKKLESFKLEADKAQEAITAAENHFHAVSAGLSGEDGEEASLADQLINANKDKKSAETEAKSIQMSLKHMESELAKKKAELKKVDKSYSQDMATLQSYEKEINKLKSEMSKLNYDENTYENLIAEDNRLTKELNNIREQMDSIYHSYHQLSFQYTDPVNNFNRAKVIGPVCLQFELTDPKYCIALEIAAGGKLNQIIVDNEDTGKLILARGNLKRRVTMIPLNKIQGNVLENHRVKLAEQLVGKGNVIPALACIKYDPKLTPAMQYVFGNVFICTNMDLAKKVTFHEQIRRRTVTLDGEVFDPQGTLSGGSMSNRMGRMLSDIAPIPKLKQSVHDKQNRINEIRSQIQQLRKIKEKYDALREQCELQENKAQHMKSKIEHSTHFMQLEEVKKLEKSIEEQKAAYIECGEKQKKAEKLIKELEAKTSKSSREAKIKEAEKAVANAKKKASSSIEKYNSYLTEVNGLKLEIEGIIESLPELETSIQTSDQALETLQNKLEESEIERNKIKESVAQASKAFKEHKEIMKSRSIEIAKISKEKEKCNKEIGNAELQIQQLEHDIRNSGDNVEEARKKVKHLADKYKWIESQKKFFGVTNSEYDFHSFNPRESHSKIKELEDKKEKLKKCVNTKAQNMLATVEDEYKSLVRKREIVLSDKAAIINVMDSLDEQTKVAIKKACKNVNRDFGSIFKSLLPGTEAKLQAPGDDYLKGLEFKVAFGGVWKESLSELSGGQRSLVALSLVLAMLLFKPAPVYILDEIDSALDLSHTQNIGTMLKQHFQKSQFIIVSLKEGMFRNANVLFRTEFKDGMSTVKRQLGEGHKDYKWSK